MEKITFLVKGTRPLLTHNPAGQLTLPGSGGGPNKKVPLPQEEAAAGCYRDKDGHFLLPAEAFRKGMLLAASFSKIGKKSAASVVAACVFNDEEWCILLDPKTLEPLKEYAIDTRRAVVGKAGILRSRPRFESWACYVTLTVDMERMGTEHVLRFLQEAGVTQGAGDYRIKKGGQFGSYGAEGPVTSRG